MWTTRTPSLPFRLASRTLSGALQAIADFLEIDQDLIAVAAEASSLIVDEPVDGLADWIASPPVADKDKLLHGRSTEQAPGLPGACGFRP